MVLNEIKVRPLLEQLSIECLAVYLNERFLY